MSDTTNTHIAALEDMRLPELQARYAEVVGESTRCPNRRYLVRRITETLAAPEEQVAAATVETAHPEAEATQAVDEPRADEAPSTPQANVDTAPEAVPEQAVEEHPSEPALDAGETEAEQDVEEHPSEPAPDAEETEAEQAVEEHPSEPVPDAANADAEDAGAPAEAQAPAVKLSKLTVPELQAKYLEVVGRPSGSANSAYLCWKIRQAERGKIPVGPRRRRAPSADPRDHKVLPLRMETELVARLDEARERLGLNNRMELFRRALHVYLDGAGEGEVAALFAPEA